MSDTEYTPTTADVKDAYERTRYYLDNEGEESGVAYRLGGPEFDRWLEANNREVAAKALRDWADMQERTLEQFAYVADDCDRSETAEWCKAIRLYADRVESALGTPEQEGAE